MRRARLLLLIALAAQGSASGWVLAQSSGPDVFVAFGDFVASLAQADATSYVGQAGARVESAAAFEQMRQHALSLYEGVTALHSFLLGSQYVDCIPVLQQPSVRLLGLKEIAPPPPPVHAPRNGGQPPPPSPLERGLADRFGNAIQCQSGTIPMRRITLEELSRFTTLGEYFQKSPAGEGAAPPAVNANQYRYAFDTRTVNNLGEDMLLNVWYPPVDQTPGVLQHSLSQVWLTGGIPTQTVEGGWQVAPYHYRTTAAVLFIYWTADGYNHTGCYNLECPAFVQTSNTVVLGAPNWPGPSTPGGQQVTFDLEWYLSGGNWWLAHNCDSCLVGYYPGSLYQNGQMARYAQDMQFGGEVWNYNGAAFPPMGSGRYARAGAGYAAFVDSIYFFDSTGIHPADLHSGVVNTCYSLVCATTPCNNIFFGGPGGTVSMCPQ